MEWLHTDDLKNYKPLRLILRGAGGSGKSVFVNTAVTSIRKMFNRNDVVQVTAPTGVAAFNSAGETMHHFWSINANGCYKPPLPAGSARRQKLLDRLNHLIALFVDERSMISTELLGTASQLTAETIFDGHNAQHDWGGLPVLVLVGDDYQLPSVGPGAFSIFDISKKKNSMQKKGELCFQALANDVYELPGNKRLREDDCGAGHLNKRLRTGQPSHEDVKKLLELDLANILAKHGPKAVEEIKKDAIYLYANNEPILHHNLNAVAKHVTKQNPLAIIKSTNTGTEFRKAISNHFDNDLPQSTVICRKAKVSIVGKNFMPLWGLHNGACGEVVDIVYEKGKNPNDGDLPRYVVVHFPYYCGPAWDVKNPKHVPMPCVTVPCNLKRKCCTRTYVPLTLAFARTIHKFQGLSAGPTDAHQLPNMYTTIICDPGDRKREGNCPGLLYTAVSRATTLGGADNLGSAFYFVENSINTERVVNLTYKDNGNSTNQYAAIDKRNRWIAMTETGKTARDNTRQTVERIQQTITNALTKRYSITYLERRIKLYNRTLRSKIYNP